MGIYVNDFSQVFIILMDQGHESRTSRNEMKKEKKSYTRLESESLTL